MGVEVVDEGRERAGDNPREDVEVLRESEESLFLLFLLFLFGVELGVARS